MAMQTSAGMFLSAEASAKVVARPRSTTRLIQRTNISTDLYHSFVESPDMMNVYNGNVVTDKHGMATVVLPEYFEALNRDFRYQLTVVGQFAQAIVAKKVDHNRFVIRTSKPNVEVSWRVTGIRQDAYANAHRIEVEEDKPQQEQGHYLHPELFGALPEQAVGYQAPSTPTHAETARAATSTTPSSPLK